MKEFEVWATYAKSIPLHSYIVHAKDKKEAKEVFKEFYPWLNIIKEIKEVNNVK